MAHCQIYYPRELAIKMWDLLVVNPVTPDDYLLGLSFCLNVSGFFCPETSQHLLTHCITALPCEQLPKVAWDCFLHYLLKVSGCT